MIDLSKYTDLKYREVGFKKFQVSGLDKNGTRVFIGFVESIPKTKEAKTIKAEESK